MQFAGGHESEQLLRSLGSLDLQGAFWGFNPNTPLG